MKKAFLAWECPRCHASTFDFPATSRRDNKTEICSECGVSEAMADYFGKADNWLDKAETVSPERP
jgi:ribosomal protein S27AE